VSERSEAVVNNWEYIIEWLCEKQMI
jgi:hypothetical protein